MGFDPVPARSLAPRRRGPAKTPVYEAMAWIDRTWVNKHGRRPTAREMADLLCEHASALDFRWRRRNPAARRSAPPPDEMTPDVLLNLARLGVQENELTLGDLIPEKQIEHEREEAILSVPARTPRERQALEDLAWIHALGAPRSGMDLAESRQRATAEFERRFNRSPVKPTAWQLREGDRRIKRTWKRERKDAFTFRRALGKLPSQPPAKREATIRDWRRLKRRAEENEKRRATALLATRGVTPPAETIEEYERRVMEAALEASLERQAPDSGRELHPKS